MRRFLDEEVNKEEATGRRHREPRRSLGMALRPLEQAESWFLEQPLSCTFFLFSFVHLENFSVLCKEHTIASYPAPYPPHGSSSHHQPRPV